MRIKDIPWYNRPGMRLKKKGVNALSDAELFAIIIGRGSRSENAGIGPFSTVYTTCYGYLYKYIIL